MDFNNLLKDLNISLTDYQLDQFKKYYELLVEYNKVMNLTGITELDEVYLKHFYDSLTLVKAYDFKNDISLCDVGSGAGFPAIPLKIAFPNIEVTIVDSLGKRIEFLNTVIKELKLENIKAIHARAEEFDKRESFDVVTSRALANINIGLELCMPLVKVDGYYLPMVVSYDLGSNTIKTLGGKLIDELIFNLPVENSERRILKIKKVEKTLGKYPRAFAQIKKKPLR
ncbi:MAG: 16S rRNA (guanine(527)-N(7))-methyltransferase RsmG [Acholeplasmatales bacterium]|nr:16S rRNA (guanine(527)-N(7))-methyltransferase RsmG [Acholeplasmatales bacterium]